VNKKYRGSSLTIVALLITSLAACGGGSSSDSDNSSAETLEDGASDSAAADAGSSDTGANDAGTTDTGSTDTGAADTGTTDDGMTDPMDNVDIATAIRGAWVSECEVFAGGDLSARQIFVFNNSQLIRDWYEFDGGQCAGVPRGKRFPLLVDNYTLGASLTTTDNISAMEIDLTLKQLPESDYKPGLGEVVQTGLDVGDSRYTIVSYRNGKVLWQDREPTNADNRFTNFDNALELSPHTPFTTADISAEAIYGFYKTSCRTTSDNNYVYTVTINGSDNIERFQDHFFFNHLCLGEAQAITETPTTLEFGNVFTNDFGDTLLETKRTRQQQFIVKGEDLISFPLKEPRDTRFSAAALAGDTLLNGDCIIRVEECKNSAEYPADHVDYEFNSSIRHVRTDSAEPAPGSSDTSIIAGAWDATYDVASGGQDIFYYVISSNGLVTYYDFQNDALGNEDDCYSIYTENLTNYGNNQYLYEGFYFNGDPYSYAETVTVSDGELTYVGESGQSTIVPQYTGDLSALNECS